MKTFNTYGTFGCINQISHTDKNGKVTTKNVSALKFLEHRNRKTLVLTDEQKRMIKQHEYTIKWMKEYNSWPIEKKYDYFNTYWVWHKKEFGYISPQSEKNLQEIRKKVELEKKMKKIKAHVFAIDKWNQMTTEQINSEVQSTIKESEYKLDCEKKNIEYHSIQHV